jgi:glyoxylase-like metal-dependent hydrolase (beta-lactamase superfamily II)
VILWRQADRVAICGDVVRNMTYATTRPGVREPPRIFTLDIPENRRSIRKLADLRPAITLAGHGGEIKGSDGIERLAQRLGV